MSILTENRGVERKIAQQLVEWKGKPGRKPLLLMGVRQVGKTYALKEFASKHFPRVHYLNFEQDPKLGKIFEVDFHPKRILNELSFYLDHPIDPESEIVIFDEIQACGAALTSLKYFAEELPQLALCAAGSLLGTHLASYSFPVGKVEMLTLYPLSFEEFLLACEDRRGVEALQQAGMQLSQIIHDHLWQQLKHYFVVGGMPEAVATYCAYRQQPFTAFTEVRQKQEHLLLAYYSDIAKHAGKAKALHLDRVLRSIPGQLEQRRDGTASRFRFTGVVPGVNRYARLAGAIDWLLAAGLAIKVHIISTATLPLRAHVKENAFKLLLFDIGILGSMCALSPKTLLKDDYGSYKGYFAQNYVAQAFLTAQKQELYCWQEKSAEVEFLREIEGGVIPIEVKSGKNLHAKSLAVFTQKYTPPYRVLFSARPPAYDDQRKLLLLPLYLAGRFPL